MAHVGHGGQRLPPEAKCLDARQVLISGQLAGGESLTDDWQVFSADPVAVVLDLDPRESSVLRHDRDGGGAGVNRVLDELLHRRGGTLNHLARCDPVDGLLTQPMDHRDRHGERVDEGGGIFT